MVAKIAHMKTANPGRTRAMIERGSGYEVDAKLCYSVPDDASQINETEVYVAFMDRFYTVPETAIMALAVNRSGSGPFTILGFVNGAILQLDSDPPIMMARLLTFADHQIRHAFATRSTLPQFVIQQELSIPEGYADLGDRQLNEILSNTRYHVRRRRAYDNVQDQFKVARAFESRSDVRDTPGGSRGRSVPAQPLTLPIPAGPRHVHALRVHPDRMCASASTSHRPRLLHSQPMPRGTVRPRSLTTLGTRSIPSNLGSRTSRVWTASSGLASMHLILASYKALRIKPSRSLRTSTITSSSALSTPITT